MSSNVLEVLDANIIILPQEPLKQIANPVSLLEGRELESFLRKPLTISQGVNLDVASGVAIATFQIESMRSQKTISLSSLRIEVHDRSGEPDFEKAQLPETMVALVNTLPIGPIKAIGANWEVMFKSQEGVYAGTEIAEKLLRQDTNFLPQNMTIIGGAARMFLSDPSSSVAYILAIEPRGQNALTDELWMSCNANLNNVEDLSIELLKDMFQRSYRLLFEVKGSLFPTL